MRVRADEVHIGVRHDTGGALGDVTNEAQLCRTTFTCIRGVSDLFFKCGTSTGGWQRGSLTPQMSPALLPTAAPDCDTGGTKRRPMHRGEVVHSQRHRPIDLKSPRSCRRAFRRRAARPEGGTQLPSLCSPVFRQSKSNSPPIRGMDEGLRRRVGLRLRGTLRPLERQHLYARPALVNRQECASLEVLTVRFECPGDYANGAL